MRTNDAHAGEAGQYRQSSEEARLEDIHIQWEGPVSRTERDSKQIKTSDVCSTQLVWRMGRTLKNIPRKTKARMKGCTLRAANPGGWVQGRCSPPADETWASASHWRPGRSQHHVGSAGVEICTAAESRYDGKAANSTDLKMYKGLVIGNISLTFIFQTPRKLIIQIPYGSDVNHYRKLKYHHFVTFEMLFKFIQLRNLKTTF